MVGATSAVQAPARIFDLAAPSKVLQRYSPVGSVWPDEPRLDGTLRGFGRGRHRSPGEHSVPSELAAGGSTSLSVPPSELLRCDRSGPTLQTMLKWLTSIRGAGNGSAPGPYLVVTRNSRNGRRAIDLGRTRAAQAPWDGWRRDSGGGTAFCRTRRLQIPGKRDAHNPRTRPRPVVGFSGNPFGNRRSCCGHHRTVYTVATIPMVAKVSPILSAVSMASRRSAARCSS